MKKGLKITIIIFCIVIAVFVVDSAQALIFNNSPIIKVRKYYDGGTLHYKDGGLFVDTYCGVNGVKDTVIKGFSYSLTFDEKIEIIDKTKESNISCDEAEQKFYEDENFTYYYPCIKSEYVIVKYSDGSQETVEEALAKEKIKIGDLDKFDIHYIKESKTSSSIVDGYCGNTETTIYFDDSTKYTFMGDNSVTLTDILKNLDYKSENMCKCLPEYTVDTEFGTGYGINLSHYGINSSQCYARYNGGQASLTDQQVKTIKEIISWAKIKAE